FCEISGRLSRVSTGASAGDAAAGSGAVSGGGSSPRSSSGSPEGRSSRARRCASSLAFSAFLSASRSRLIGKERRRSEERLALRPEQRCHASRIRLAEIVFRRHLVAEATEVAVDAGLLDHRGAQEDDELGLAAELRLVGEDVAD